MARKILVVKFIEMEEAKTGGKITAIFLTDLTTVYVKVGVKKRGNYHKCSIIKLDIHLTLVITNEIYW